MIPANPHTIVHKVDVDSMMQVVYGVLGASVAAVLILVVFLGVILFVAAWIYDFLNLGRELVERWFWHKWNGSKKSGNGV